MAHPERTSMHLNRAEALAESPWPRFWWALILAFLAGLTLLIHGYHPLAEDGGVYVAGVEYTLNPALFPHYTAFVREHLRFSLFAPCIAALVHLTHLRLAWILFAVDLASLWLTFYAARQVLRRCFVSNAAQLAGLALLAAWATLPVAGTSLLLIDPYVTARSLSTPLSLWAIAFALDDWTGREASQRSRSARSVLGCVLCLIAAALLHPLMAAYGAAMVAFVRAARSPHRYRAWAALTVLALLLAAVVRAIAAPESPAVVAATYSRYYWFLSQWQWFELLGLAGPLLILLAIDVSVRRAPALRQRAEVLARAIATLCHACIGLGLTAVLVALLFAREGAPTHLVARLQPLRVFLLTYALMPLLLGATLAQIIAYARRRSRVSSHAPAARARLRRLPSYAPGALGAVLLLGLAAVSFYVQRQTFPASQHLELPWRAARNPNPWTQAFVWARAHTPPDALFALDARYVNEDGEDAQTFRATALRSALPDFSKDGGEASITPALATLWQQGAAAQVDLSAEPDSVRAARLRPLGVTWMVLHSSAATHFPCPYDNGTVKVCRLTP